MLRCCNAMMVALAPCEGTHRMFDLQDLIVIVKAIRKDRHGVTALEYGLIAGSIALAIISSVNSLGGKISNVFSSLASANWG